MKKLLALMLMFCLLLGVAPFSLAAEGDDPLVLSKQLQSLGLFQGVGNNADGSTNFDLNRTPTRLESLIMLLRMLGKDDVAKATVKSHPFTDVPSWADGYVSYAYAQKLSAGIDKYHFDPNSAAPVNTYLTFLLRALGYVEGADFIWDSPYAQASYSGILQNGLPAFRFTRGEAVKYSVATLHTLRKDSAQTQAAQLIADGVFDRAQWDKAFPTDPFARYRAIDKAVSREIAARKPLGYSDHDSYAVESHLVTKLREEGQTLYLSVMFNVGPTEIQPDHSFDVYPRNEFWLLELDAKSLAYQAHTEIPEDQFHSAAFVIEHSGGFVPVGNWWLIANQLTEVSALQINKLIAQGLVTYRAPNYEEALKKLTDSAQSHGTQVDLLEAAQCTLVGFYVSTTRGGFYRMTAVYKAGATLGEGHTFTLPSIGKIYSRNNGEPDQYSLSADGNTLQYSYHVEDAAQWLYDGEMEPTGKQGPGSFHFVVDLRTGSSVKSFIPD